MIFRRKDQQGFTLLEMVLVLLIMGMVASLSVVFIDNEDNQLRYEETVQKLEAMHKATVTVKDYKDGFLLSGFVVDNGVLPSAAKDYVSMPTGWAKRTLFSTTNNKPKFRISEDESAYQVIDQISLNKGYRTGYISLGIDSTGDYKTGWGENFIVARDTTPPTPTHSLKLTYDETLNPPNYSNSMNKNVDFDSWSIALSELNITIENKTTDITNPIIVALTVFKNIQIDLSDSDKANDSVWQTYHFTVLPVAGISLASNSTHNSVLDGAVWKSEADVDVTAIRIPAGEHIIFVGEDGDTTTCASPNTANQKIESCEIKDQKILKVIPRYTLLPVLLVIE